MLEVGAEPARCVCVCVCVYLRVSGQNVESDSLALNVVVCARRVVGLPTSMSLIVSGDYNGINDGKRKARP